MEWYYAEGTEQRGPVSEDEFQRLVTAGTVRPDTLVWRQGMATWQPWGQVSQVTAAAAPVAAVESAGATAVASAPGQGGLLCSQCGKGFPPEQVMRYGDLWVCAGCKPLFLQRVREGGGQGVLPGQLTADQLLERDYDVELSGSINRGWEVLRANLGLLIGGSVLVYLTMFAMNIIPYLSIVLSLVFTGPLMGGIWMLFVRTVRGEMPSVGDAFGGFGPRFGQLLMVYLATSLLAGLCLVPMLIPVVFLGVSAAAAQQGGGAMPMPGVFMIVIFGMLGVLGVGGWIYLTVSWFFAMPLVIDKRLGFWDAMRLSRAMVGKHWWATFGLFIVLWILAMLGLLGCLIGILITGPLAMAALCVHYQKVFGDLREDAM